MQGPLTGQALSMLSAEAAQEWEEVMRVLQQAAAVLEGAALNIRQLNADLSATQIQLRASEFELKALRSEHAAAQRTLHAQQRQARCNQQVWTATDACSGHHPLGSIWLARVGEGKRWVKLHVCRAVLLCKKDRRVSRSALRQSKTSWRASAKQRRS